MTLTVTFLDGPLAGVTKDGVDGKWIEVYPRSWRDRIHIKRFTIIYTYVNTLGGRHLSAQMTRESKYRWAQIRKRCEC